MVVLYEGTSLCPRSRIVLVGNNFECPSVPGTDDALFDDNATTLINLLCRYRLEFLSMSPRVYRYGHDETKD